MGPRRSTRGRIATISVMVLAGGLIGATASNSKGLDLRPGNSDLPTMVRTARDRNVDLTSRAADLRKGVERLSSTLAQPETVRRGDELERSVGMTAVRGPAVKVVLRDAPPDVRPLGVNEDLLVVHQQDIQAVSNALWAGEAEAMTIQGQRVTTATGIKCVGNTVVIHGIPYAPPYELVAIGDVKSLQAALDDSGYLKTYREQALAYKLGYAVTVLPETKFPAFTGRTELTYARAKS